MTGSLLTFVSSLFILDDILNLPSWIFFIMSVTGLESARMRIGCFDFLKRLYSELIVVAMPGEDLGPFFRGGGTFFRGGVPYSFLTTKHRPPMYSFITLKTPPPYIQVSGL